MLENHLVIGDLQAPFHHKNAIPFLKRIVKEFRIPKQNVFCAGDELDHYYLSKYPKNPDMKLSAVMEYEESMCFLKEMYDVFPIMRLCESNHGNRPLMRVLDAYIPAVFMKSYRELIEAPNGWAWKSRWVEKTKYPFSVMHGHQFKGGDPLRKAAQVSPISVAFGHHHSRGGGLFFNHTETKGTIWSANAGCLIDREALAFSYDKNNIDQPVLGSLVVTDSGHRPIFIPFDE